MLDKAVKTKIIITSHFSCLVFFVRIIGENLTDCREELLLVLTTTTGVSQGSLLGRPPLPPRVFLESSLWLLLHIT